HAGVRALSRGQSVPASDAEADHYQDALHRPEMRRVPRAPPAERSAMNELENSATADVSRRKQAEMARTQVEYVFGVQSPRLRSAVFQPAVSRISNPPAVESTCVSRHSGSLPNGIRRYSRLEICATQTPATSVAT